ncbi:hypothetical protein [Pelomonas cellulosilytica]|uniref:Uncharacterized protein n=1 Tax=Pelomonas cellulosilytica TaxID=2906762 RepID=A0ABS8XWE8_9BURK|nr:hypothetical protein [Pelomonas sp. P8]MCE4556984.1 hypothetical protein [Pelomonas sp. P8]
MLKRSWVRWAVNASKYVKNQSSARTKLCTDLKAVNQRTLVLPPELDDSLRFGCD